MLFAALYHPPLIEIDTNKNESHSLYLVHHFEGKPLIKEFILNTMMGIEYLWGGPVKLETNEVETTGHSQSPIFNANPSQQKKELKWQRVLYTMENRKLTKSVIK